VTVTAFTLTPNLLLLFFKCCSFYLSIHHRIKKYQGAQPFSTLFFEHQINILERFLKDDSD